MRHVYLYAIIVHVLRDFLFDRLHATLMLRAESAWDLYRIKTQDRREDLTYEMKKLSRIDLLLVSPSYRPAASIRPDLAHQLNSLSETRQCIYI